MHNKTKGYIFATNINLMKIMQANKLLSLIIVFLSLLSFAQVNPISKIDIVPPVDIPIYLSGTFGELRSNHFHSGIDIKTQGVVGKNIIAIADGWVSRIKISEGGYGKAIYITHNNGYVSVYGHLQKFNSAIQKIVIDKQYEKESFTVQIFPDKDELQVKKGDIIGFSGNTGSSMGPHLHFEIRELESQYPVNPLFNKNIKIKDYYRPKITKLAIYPVDDSSFINGKQDTLYLDIEGWGLKHRIKDNEKISASGNISFAISTIDLMNDISNKNGVYSIKFLEDTLNLFQIDMEKLSFSTTRYINSIIDYSYFMQNKKRLVKTQVDTNNNYNFYKKVVNNGILNINDTLTHNLTYEITDVYGNISNLKFDITGEITDSLIVDKDSVVGELFLYNTKNSIVTDSLIATFPANIFYKSFYFDYDIHVGDSVSFSDTYKLHNRLTPVHKNFNLKILPNTTDTSLLNKLYVAYSSDNDDYSFVNNNKKAGFITCKSRKLGYYKLLIDTISPIIKTVNFYDGKKLTKQRNLKVKIKDNETGIKSYRAMLNNNWILMEYDAKNNILIYNFDERITKGKNEFEIEVIDLLGNSSGKTIDFDVIKP